MRNNSYMIANSVNIDDIPQVVKLLPLGNVSSQKGNFIVDNSSYNAINQQFSGRKVDIVIDYEHQTLENKEAPAGGWIKELIMKSDGIYARVEWTSRAKEFIKAKEYRYLSPVVLVDKETRKVKALHSVALTNTPAIDGMEAIINSMNKGVADMESSQDKATKQEIKQNKPQQDLLPFEETQKAIAKELGLKEDASTDEILNAIKQLVSDKSESDIVANKLIVEQINAKSEGLVQMALSIGQIDQSQTEWAYKRCAEDVEGFRFFVEGAYKKECDKVVQLALKGGKIAPYQKEWAEQLALKDLDCFRTFVNQSLPIVSMGELEYFKDDTYSTSRSTGNQHSVNELLGLSDDVVKKYSK